MFAMPVHADRMDVNRIQSSFSYYEKMKINKFMLLLFMCLF